MYTLACPTVVPLEVDYDLYFASQKYVFNFPLNNQKNIYLNKTIKNKNRIAPHRKTATIVQTLGAYTSTAAGPLAIATTSCVIERMDEVFVPFLKDILRTTSLKDVWVSIYVH